MKRILDAALILGILLEFVGTLVVLFWYSDGFFTLRTLPLYWWAVAFFAFWLGIRLKEHSATKSDACTLIAFIVFFAWWALKPEYAKMPDPFFGINIFCTILLLGRNSYCMGHNPTNDQENCRLVKNL